ncbi:ABC transporter permease [Sporomusa carbonis]|uniref:ABC transporter permease n=1 Tax=Sporomusa carbonis TaxID=3076075 RepID=UPI003C7DB595
MLIDFALGNWQLNSYSATLGEHSQASAIRVYSGFGLAVVLGLPLGYLSGRITGINRLIDPLIQLIRTVPGIGWLPLAMVWFGVGERMPLFVIALAAFFPIYVNTVQGICPVG